MLKFGNKEFRNLQEQVLKNMSDIQDVMSGATVLADFGIKVIGQVDDAKDLPDPATYEGEYGDAYIVGDEAPYDFYIFTRAFEGQEEPTWFNLGIFPQPGPQGPQGEAGTPVFPEIAVAASATTLAAGSSAKATVTSTGSDSNPLFTFTFEIPQGAQGIQGLTGPQGATGPMGPRGYINLLRPNASSCVAIGEGYMDASGNLQLLVSLDPKEFDNCGQIRGPQGFTGPQGPRGDAGYMSILRATAEDCVELGDGYMNSSGYLMILTELDPRTFTNCGQLRGPQGSTGAKGPTGYVNIIRPNAAACTELYDAYVDSNGNLQILTTLPDTFTYGGRIKGETGTAATIQVGNVITGEPGTPATVVNRGSSSAAIFDFTIPQGTPGEDVGINPVIPSGTPTSSLVAIKSGNAYYTVPQGETSLVFNVSIPSGETGTAISTIKDGQNYYTVPTKTSDLTNDSGFITGVSWSDISGKPTFATVATSGDYDDLSNKPTIPDAVSGTNDGTNWTTITIGDTTKAIGTGTGTANITFNATVPSGTTPTNLTTIKDDNTDTYYSIAGGGGTANIEFNPTIPSGTTTIDLTALKDDNTNTYYNIAAGGTTVQALNPNDDQYIFRNRTIEPAKALSTGTDTGIVISELHTKKARLTTSPTYDDIILKIDMDGGQPYLGMKAEHWGASGSASNYKYSLGKKAVPWYDLVLSNYLRDPDGNRIKVAQIVAKQDALVSGINIKTINNQSILGSGNIDATEVEANVQIPEGATVVELQNIKIGNTYYIMPGQTRYIVGDTLVDNSSTSSISNNTLTDNSVDINTTTNTLII